jgi:hypothetical protein
MRQLDYLGPKKAKFYSLELMKKLYLASLQLARNTQAEHSIGKNYNSAQIKY